MDNIAEVTVYGDKHPITGNIVCAKFRLKDTEEISEFRKRLRKYCSRKIEEYKIPVKSAYKMMSNIANVLRR